MFKLLQDSIRSILSDDICHALDFSNENKQDVNVTTGLLGLFTPYMLDIGDFSEINARQWAKGHTIPIKLNDRDTLNISLAAIITSSDGSPVGSTFEKIEQSSKNHTYAYMEDDIASQFDISFDVIKMTLQVDDNEEVTIFSTKTPNGTYIVAEDFQRNRENCSHHVHLMRFEVFASCYNAVSLRRRKQLIEKSRLLKKIVGGLPTKLRQRGDIHELLFKGLIEYFNTGFVVSNDLSIHYSYIIDSDEHPAQAMEFLRDNLEAGYLSSSTLIDSVNTRIPNDQFDKLSKILEIS